MQNAITIHDTTVAPGREALIKLSAGRLPSGNLLQICTHVFHSRRPGPTVLVLGGVHGDEINGVAIVGQALREDLFSDLRCGTVIAIPLLNLYGFIHFSRELPDGKDVNRSFPGNSKGSLASRVARLLTQHILPHADLGVDFHSGGNGLYNYPQIRFSGDDPSSETLARAFGAPFLIAKRPIARSLRKAALRDKKPILVFEGGENHRHDPFATHKALEGLRRLLQAQGMVGGKAEPARCRLFRKTAWMRAPRAGMFYGAKAAGQRVRKGEPLGRIDDPQSRSSVTVFATRDGYCIGHRNSPVISQGDALFHLAYEMED